MASIRERVRRRGTEAAGFGPGFDPEELRERGEQAGDVGGLPSGAAGAAAAGALGGTMMGAVFGGPVGLAVGGLVGVLSHLDSQRQAGKMADWQNTLNDLDERTTRSIDAAFDGAEDQADRDQLEARNTNWRNTMDVLQQAGPEQGQQILAQLATSGRLDAGVRDELGEMQARQHTLDDQARTAMISSTQKNAGDLIEGSRILFREQRAAQEAYQRADMLLSDPSVDLDNPAVRAELSKVLDQTQRNMMANPEDMTDALRGVGGTGLVGLGLALASIGFGVDKAEQMRISREEWRQLLAATEIAAQGRYTDERENFYASAAENVRVAEKLGLMPDETLRAFANLQGSEERLSSRQIAESGGYETGVEGPKRRLFRPTNGGTEGGEGGNRGVRGEGPVGPVGAGYGGQAARDVWDRTMERLREGIR